MKRLLFPLLLLVLCARAEDLKWPVEIGGMLFENMETALCDEDRTRGLMFRESLPEDGGMIFLFKKPEMHSFWMRNTRIPLDILFIDKEGRITAIHTMPVEKPQGSQESDEAYCDRLPGYSSLKPAIAAIEINAGMAATLNLKVGDKVEIFQKELSKHLK
ncbi:MAG: DUF192 domain-containing protein [Victivallales bacterium]|nr:DUF192 domain-containing protein [Victivallales bacterium]